MAGKLKKRANDNIEKTVDEGLDAIEGKNPDVVGQGPNGDIVIVSRDEEGNNAPLMNFIHPGTAIFVDDFNIEKPTEFPSKWTQMDGTFQNAQALNNGQKDGMVEVLTNKGTMRPTIVGDRYLGHDFKLEMQVYFHNMGNEQYIFKLKNTDNIYTNHEVRVGNGIMWNGSEAISRMPEGLWGSGWHTIQLSFNRGNLKGYLDGIMLINDPDITTNPDYVKDFFTHLEVNVLSPSSNANPRKPGRITYFAIGGKGHDLYNALKSEGKLVMNNINFEVNSYIINPSSYGVLDEIAGMMNAYREINLSVQGHTDSDGTNEFNQTLSENRAKAVVDYLVKKGISGKRLSSMGYGEKKPIDPTSSEMAKAKNRRVEFVLQ